MSGDTATLGSRLRRCFSREHAVFAGIFAVTMLGLLSIGATLPVLPRYVKGPIGAGNVSVGIVIGAFAITGLACRPLAGHFADARGRRPAVILGALLSAAASALYFVPAGVPGLIVARLFLGAGEGMVYTAGSAWVIDLAAPARRGRVIGLYGLAIWGGLSLGPSIGELLLHAGGFDLVWAFALGAPLLAAAIATRIPESSYRGSGQFAGKGAFLSREALRPGLALSLGVIGFAAVAAFIVLHLDALGIGHGTTAFTAFAATVVASRILLGSLPDRIGPGRCAMGAGLVEAAGLVAIGAAPSLAVALLGAMAMGGAFALLFPSLALIVLEGVPEERRGVAMGTFTAFFDLGMGVGAPLAGAAASLGGYPDAFYVAAACALGSIAVSRWAQRSGSEQAAVIAAAERSQSGVAAPSALARR